MQQKPQFTLRWLLLLFVVIAGFLATMRLLDREWRFVLAVAGASLVISATCLALSGPKRRGALWSMLTVVSIASACLLWLGIYPALYYMGGFFFVGLLWFGVLMASIIMAVTSLLRPEPLRPGIKTTAERAFLIIPLVTTLLLCFQVPLRLGAATAIPTLANKIREQDDSATVEEEPCGLYTVRLPGKRLRRRPEQVYFDLADGWGTFVYSPTGPDDISYNAGAKGHLFGSWHWTIDD